MKILITGAGGMLGTALRQHLYSKTLIPLGKKELDVTDESLVLKTLRSTKPDIVIHCAAYTDVDGCELNPDKAYAVNAVGTKNIALGSEAVRAKLIFISTDYVFDGTLGRPYREDDIPEGGLNAYGRSKFEGERFVKEICSKFIIARTAWLYGLGGENFVSTMLALARSQPKLKVVNDQIGNPTCTRAAASAIKALLTEDFNGTAHITNQGSANRFEFAQKIFEISGISADLSACSSEELGRPAQRPADSRLENLTLQALGLDSLPFWEDELTSFLS